MRVNSSTLHDSIRGCLYGGAVGDALGYPVEFLQDEQIFQRYGENGITAYEYARASGVAEISDDTQMTLFTANGLLVHAAMAGQGKPALLPRTCVARAYQDWLTTQSTMFFRRKIKAFGEDKRNICWLLHVRELYSRRAPGVTCMQTLTAKARDAVDGVSFIDAAWNGSKGCGGVMRVAPVAFLRFSEEDPAADRAVAMEAAEIAAVTHGHPLGYIPAAMLAYIVRRAVRLRGSDAALLSAVRESQALIRELFPHLGDVARMNRLIDAAVTLAENGSGDLENIRALGEGWVAEEALAIAVYCSLRYRDDFSAGIIAAANHGGDSDSTAAITGNILGALLGFDAIGEKWKQKLELSDVILEIADDLLAVADAAFTPDAAWRKKYGEGVRAQS